jgi:hypothetical protein
MIFAAGGGGADQAGTADKMHREKMEAKILRIMMRVLKKTAARPDAFYPQGVAGAQLNSR